jgi:Domain of unknown function (DUF4277)
MGEGQSLRACDLKFLPIVPAYARTLELVEEVDRLIGSKRGISDGQVVLTLVLDALSGRSPLFRLPQAFAKLDTELLLEKAISPERLNDDAVAGRWTASLRLGQAANVPSHLLHDDDQVCVNDRDTNRSATVPR